MARACDRRRLDDSTAEPSMQFRRKYFTVILIYLVHRILPLELRFARHRLGRNVEQLKFYPVTVISFETSERAHPL